LHPVAVAVRSNEPARVAVADDRHRRRPGPARPPSGNGEEVRARPREAEPGQRTDDRVQGAAPDAQPVRLRRGRRGGGPRSAILAEAFRDTAHVGFTIFRQDEVDWQPRAEDDPRKVARLSDALSQSRANLWRYPPGSIGRRHCDNAQEEVFVVLDGTLTVDLGDPPERHEVPRGGV